MVTFDDLLERVAIRSCHFVPFTSLCCLGNRSVQTTPLFDVEARYQGGKLFYTGVSFAKIVIG